MTEDAVTLVPESIRDARSLTFDQLAARLQGLPVAVCQVMAIDRVPASALPALAEHFGVAPLFERLADEKQRRHLVKHALRLQRKRGTLAGFEEVARLYGWEIPRAVMHPAKSYLGSSDPARQAERLAYLPRVRIYRHLVRGRAQGLFAGWRSFAGVRHLVPSTAAERYRRQASWIDGGKETPLALIDRGAVLETRLPGKAGAASFAARPPRFLVPSTADRRLFRYSLDPSLVQRLVPPASEPLPAGFQPVARRGVAQGVYAGHPLTKRHRCLVASTAADRLAAELILADPRRPLGEGHQGTAFAGIARLGLPPFTAELHLRLRGQLAVRQVRRHLVGFLGAPSAAERIDAAREVLDPMRAARDRVLMLPRVFEVAKASDWWVCGELVCGQAVV